MNGCSRVDLILPLGQELVSLLQRCVEESARAFGMDDGGCLRLTLAAEEVYAFLLARGLKEERVSVSVLDGGADVEVRLSLPDGVLPLESFNLVPENGSEPISGPRQGLFLAARTVSSLEASRKGREMVLSFRQDRAYAPTKVLDERVQPDGPWKIRAAGVTEVLQLAARAASRPAGQRPPFVLQEGKAADLLTSGQWGAFVAVDPRGSVGAGLFWERRGKTAFLHGPWDFAQSGNLAESVLNACLGALSRMDFVGVSLVAPTPETPLELFEVLGQLPSGDSREVTAYYRLLREDDGGPLYLHSSMEGPVREMVDSLCLPRAVHVIDSVGHNVPERSALAVRIGPEPAEATLSTLASGRDGTANLLSHLEVLADQGIGRVRFALDLGRAEDVLMGACLLKAGFEPRVLLPWAGRGDILLLTPSGR